MRKKTEVDNRVVIGHLGLMLFFGVVGYLCGGFFGAFVGACVAYLTWWLKEIHDDIKKHIVKADEPTK